MRSLTVLYPHIPHQHRPTIGPPLLVPRKIPDLQNGVSTALILANPNKQPSCFDQSCTFPILLPCSEGASRCKMPVQDSDVRRGR